MIGRILAEIRRDVATAKIRDPAAREVGPLQILATWPGVHALLAHRLAHTLHSIRVPFLPLWATQAARWAAWRVRWQWAS